MFFKNEGVLHVPVILFMDAVLAKTPVITHLDDFTFYNYTEKDCCLIIQAADVFVKSHHKSAPFRSIAFHRLAKALLDAPHVHRLVQGVEKVP